MRSPDPERQAVAVFAALTDPTRRALLDDLARSGPATVTELARRLPVSRQALAKHLGQLSEAGLVSSGPPTGRRHPYRLEPAAIRAAQVWLALLANRWDDRLAALATALDATEANANANANANKGDAG
ncbi:metalloregulator ArsR/SmtB family transcription factor [Streptomyces sp. DSM 44915]|uniref:Metalloregulator ArsR/SmtB family transcription factor n=1 Tax=Streptomyces chisholmiae TaxID=3075540 RepID=A0ABU2JYG1_9ACTN|nr:metalloregulator ArsR/SmtB family transcription factor [Streptomyces sp. DSM 44915]MDT0270045.1 metalloregulator ArsR/SmtB family transcription factor [Streptomyces sp. DSM 44915]